MGCISAAGDVAANKSSDQNDCAAARRARPVPGVGIPRTRRFRGLSSHLMAARYVLLAGLKSHPTLGLQSGIGKEVPSTLRCRDTTKTAKYPRSSSQCLSRPASPCRVPRPCPHWSPATRTPSARW
ncbi:hypothetical protein EIQ18_22205 [Xanthomonas campestris pv. campestris]